MKERLSGSAPRALFAVAALLVFGLLGASRAQAQTGPCTVTGTLNQQTIALRAAIYNLQQQATSVTCDNANMYVTMPNGDYFRLTFPQDAAASLFAFSPVTGETIYWYIVDTDYGPNLLIQDSTRGFINAGDGWADIFYPVGNPFSAAVQNPMQSMFQATNSNPDPWGINTSPSPRPAPMQACCEGVY